MEKQCECMLVRDIGFAKTFDECKLRTTHSYSAFDEWLACAFLDEIAVCNVEVASFRYHDIY